MNKPDCYECIHRGSVPGSAHSTCNHPAMANINNNPLISLMGILAGVGRVAPMPIGTMSKDIKVVGNPHGIERGWFNHPMNFDPVWLESCTGFDPKKEVVDETPSQQQPTQP